MSLFDSSKNRIKTVQIKSRALSRPAQEILSKFQQTQASTTLKKTIWAIGGGKGGVGKSLFSANTAIALAQQGYKVLSIDLDLGGANLHTCLGVPIPQKTLSDYISKKVININDVIVKTPIPNLSLVSGAQDEIGIANLKQTHKNMILKSLENVEADFILLDLGAGTSFNTLDFFIAADQGFLVSLPEPTAIENTYRFIKSVFYRRLSMFEETFDIQHLINQAHKAKINQSASSPLELIKKIKSSSPKIGQFIEQEMAKMHLNLVINQVRTQNDRDLGFAIEKVAKGYFGINVNYAGYLEYDSAVWQSVKRKTPLMKEFPNAHVAQNIQRITSTILKGLS